MVFVCKLTSSEQMICLCLFKKQAVSRDRCIHHPNNRTAFRPPLCPASAPDSKLSGQHSISRAHSAPGARVQILQTQPHIPEPTTHRHSLLRVDKMSRSRQIAENIPFSTSCTSRRECYHHFSRFIKHL